MAECAGLENQCTFTGTVGSNPTLSAFYCCIVRMTSQGSERSLRVLLYATSCGIVLHRFRLQLHLFDPIGRLLEVIIGDDKIVIFGNP